MSILSTQTEDYWANLQIEQNDINHLYSILLDKEEPLSIDQMALALMRYRIEHEASDPYVHTSGSGHAYRPDAHYEVGDELAFPALGNVTGKVVGVRRGQNPDSGDFNVIQAKLDDKQVLEFASDLAVPHKLALPLNRPDGNGDRPVLSPEELFIEYGGIVAEVLEEALEGHDDLVSLAGYWFARSLLADVNEGHLNLAEAVLDMAGGGPLTTPAILEQIGMLTEVNDLLAEFSMNFALQKDPRFDEVGPAGHVWWYLTRLEPAEVQKPPARLAYAPIEYDQSKITEELRELEIEIGDEHSPPPKRSRSPLPHTATITLTYHHHQAGTLPLSIQLRRMFPMAYSAQRIHFTLIDAQTGREMPAWVVRQGGYVYGLAEWLRDNEIPVGGYLSVERTTDPGRVLIDCARRRPRKDWVRTAIVENNRLRFVNQQWSIACDYDDLMIVAVPDPERIDALWEHTRKTAIPLERLLMDMARELMPLNPQSNVHAKTLYSALNLIRRCPPGPILDYLHSSPQFEHMGGFYYRLTDQTSGQ